MNPSEIKGDWNIAKGRLKQKWANLTEDDLAMPDNQSDELIARIQIRTGETRAEVEQAIQNALSDTGSY